MSFAFTSAVVSVLPRAATADAVTAAWTARYTGNGRGCSVARALAVTPEGGVVVAGGARQDGPSFFTVVRYGAGGRQLWDASHRGHQNGLVDVVVDGAGNAYVAGEAWTSNQPDCVTLKYDPGGQLLWEAVFDESDGVTAYGEQPVDLELDGEGNLLVAVRSTAAVAGRWIVSYLVLKYAPTGELLWTARYEGPGDKNGGRLDLVTAIAVDAAGNVCVTGMSHSDTYLDYATVKYDSGGKRLWVARYDGAGLDDGALDVAVDAQGNLYVTGQSYGGDSHWDVATIQYDPDGNALWVARYDDPTFPENFGAEFALGQDGSVYLAGASCLPPVPPSEGFERCGFTVLRYSPEGRLVWSRRYEAANGPYWASGSGIALDRSENVYVTGRAFFVTPPRVSSFLTVKYDSGGNALWAASCDGANDSGALPYDIALDPDGNVYVTGVTNTTPREGVPITCDFLTIKYVQEPRLPFLRGEANADGQENIADAVSILAFLFRRGSAPPCADAADADDDGRVNISDAVYLLRYRFGVGAGPPDPFPGCGTDPRPDLLGCASYPPCG